MNLNSVKNDHGYTLIEMLIVLFFVMCLTAIVMKFSLKQAEIKELERFFYTSAIGYSIYSNL